MQKIVNTEPKPSFESRLHKLEQIVSDTMVCDVNQLESGLEQFEKGVNLIRLLQLDLNKAQKEIDTLSHTDLSQKNLPIKEYKPTDITSLEKNVEAIKRIIAHIENDANLESSLAQFKQGIDLVSNTQAMLEKAEQRVRILTENNNTALEEFS